MLLHEFLDDISFSPLGGATHYDDQDDQTVMKQSDKRKTRLTLRQLNRLRRILDLRRFEKQQDLEKTLQIYAQPAAPAP